jgi:hypothetical protein
LQSEDNSWCMCPEIFISSAKSTSFTSAIDIFWLNCSLWEQGFGSEWLIATDLCQV